ncbi:Ras-GEF domain-containing member 1B [Phytophthora pseudosyringae]|uniref:Ras-GEF domain-containing member 1B n=1 Tax=Phytophthora pseudosyringae TaxID=221518 RepID=A0A8T1V9P7_9STRA|nr:Ras-GEF domain-containing member 1B [Phytophthora pseudosyringae]
MNRSALDVHRVASDVLKRDMERSGSSSSSPATDSGRGGQLSFSTFLMDEVASPVPPRRATRRPPPPPLPPLRAQGATNAPPRRYNPPPDVQRRRGESDGDIPVLEAARDSSGFRLDGADQAEVRVASDDDEEGRAEAKVVVGEYDAEEDDFVPVLQTPEDALRAHRHMGSKKFSWRASARRGVPIGRTVRVPDQETLLRMSTRSTELSSSYASSNSQGSRRSSASVRIDRELVRSGWLYKQANVMKTWKPRYFVLIKRTNLATGEYWASLHYYKGNNFAKLRGEMHLQDGMLSVRFLEPDEAKRPYSFEVAGEDFSFVCSGSNDDDASAWVCLLQSLSSGGSSTIPPSAGLVGTAAASSLLQSADGTMGNRIRTSTIDARSIRIVAELRRVLHTSKSPEAAKFKSFIGTFESRSSGSLRQLRDFHATLTESIVKDHGARILTALKDPGNDDANGTINGTGKKHDLLPISLNVLRSAVSRHVEEVLFLPLQDKINTFLRRVYHEEESSINRKVRWLQGKDQMYFNIPVHQISWKEWRKASRILAQIALVPLPAAKYDVLTSTIKAIQSTYAEEHDAISELEPLETDDIIPIFTYVLSNSGLENLISLKTLLTELNGSWAVGRSPDDETSLNILTHAVDFISNVSIPAVLEDIFKDQITLSIDGDWRRVLEFEVEPTYRYGAIVEHISPHGYSAVGTIITRGYVLVTVNGQNVVLWPFQDIMTLLLESASPHRLAFIPGSSYFKILTSNKALWNVALMHACQRGDVFSVQMLLANGADVNYVAHECGSNTPLHVAVSALHFNVVSYMLQHGAKVKTIGECGRSALHMVGSPCMMPATITTSSDMTKAANGTTSALSDSDKAVLVMKKLLAHGAPLDTVDIYGNTPVMLLAERGYLGAIDAIMEADSNIDLNARNWQRGMSALALAAKSGRANVVEGLLDYGAQVDIRTLHGETPLHFAAASASQRVCQLLVEKSCDVDVRTSEGLTPLMIAVAKDHGMAMEKIAALSPSVPSLMGDDNGHHHHHHQKTTVDLRSSIHVDNTSVISTMNYLVQSGADMSAVCEVYRTPLHYAALYGCDELFACLMAKMGDDANAERRDLYGQSAVSMAEASRSSHMLASENVTNGNCSTMTDDYCDVGDNDDADSDDDDEDEDMDDVEQADIPMSLTGRKDLSGKTLSIKDLVTEENNGVEEIIAGTFDAIADLLLRFENYRLEELSALIWYCGYASNGGEDNFREMVDILRNLWKRFSVGTEAGLYVRRVVLSALNKLVEILKHSVECDMDVCNYVAELYTELVPLQDELAKEDPQGAQWISASLLPEFADACQSNRVQEFQVLSFCEGDYTSLKQFICTAKQANPNLEFLDDDLFRAATGMEIITEALRRRMSLAGVWRTGEAKKSFVVKPEEALETLSEGRSTTITPWQPRGVNVGRTYTPEQRKGRLWILDLDPSIIAQQITLMQHYLFSKIKVSEMLASKRNAEKTPGYQRLRLLHNHISIWVVNQILMRGDVDQRAEILAYFIRVAGVLLSPLQNLDGFMAVMNAANDSSIFRLKKTWGRLPPQSRDLWQELVPLTEKGARPLNKFTKEATPPLIPYMGVVIQNVIALQEYPDRVEGDLINFKKIRSIGFLIQRILSFQKTPYLLPTDKRVLEHICSTVPFMDADACFARSLKIEPRVADAESKAS